MAKAAPAPVDAGDSLATNVSPRQSIWQLNLRTLFLLMAAIAAWTAYFVNLRQVTMLRTQITASRPLAHELIVDDPHRIAVIKLEEMWFDENVWRIYLPAHPYRLCLATHGVAGKGIATAASSVLLKIGVQQLRLDVEQVGEVWRVAVTRDGTEIMSVEEPKEWNPGIGSVGGGHYSQSTQLPADQPVVLYRRRFNRLAATGHLLATPPGPTKGILLWIEPASGTKQSNGRSGHRGM